MQQVVHQANWKRKNQASITLERVLYVALLLLLALALWGPFLPGSAFEHGFVDSRTWLGIPSAGDVLSNAAFAAAGIWGLVCWRRLPIGLVGSCAYTLMGVMCLGLLLTAISSASYHWRPNDVSLLWDRLGMCVVFAGLLGLAVWQRIGTRAAAVAGGCMLLLGPMAALWRLHTGDLWPWVVVQFGGMLLLLCLACAPRRTTTLAFNLVAVIAIYSVAKLCEWQDEAMFAATAQWLSGHSLKHLLAAAAVWPVLRAFHLVAFSAHRTPGMAGHNGAPCLPTGQTSAPE